MVLDMSTPILSGVPTPSIQLFSPLLPAAGAAYDNLEEGWNKENVLVETQQQDSEVKEERVDDQAVMSEEVGSTKTAPRRKTTKVICRKRKRVVQTIVNGEVMEMVYDIGSAGLACIICDKVYASNKFLQRHKLTKHRLCIPVY